MTWWSAPSGCSTCRTSPSYRARGGSAAGSSIPPAGITASRTAGRAGGVDRHRCQRGAVRAGDRAGGRASHRVPTDSPIWIAPRFDVPFTPEQHELFERDPGAAQQLRDETFDVLRVVQLRRSTPRRPAKRPSSARSYLMRKMADPELRAKLMPDYPVGCKRPLISARVVSHLRAARTSGWTRPRSPSSPSAASAPPTASNTASTPSSTAPDSRPPIIWPASRFPAPAAARCATTGATAPRPTWARW